MNISGHTTPYAVLGHPIGHTLSPVMHNAAFHALDRDAVYLAFDVAPEKLPEVLPSMRDMGFGGVNLTVPLKEVAFAALEDLDDSARLAGAVNTVQFLPDGSLRGHSTDGAGFVLAMAEAFDTDLAGKRVLVVGAGGAGRTVAITCAKEKASAVLLGDIDRERAVRVAEEIRELAPATETRVVSADEEGLADAAKETDVIVQATPVGMKQDDPSPIAAKAFRAGQLAFDLVYMYPETSFVKAAREGGARASNGLGMLLHQGARAFTIWTGEGAAVAAMRTALEEAVYG
ncbi:MAG: shikimate dehydrogenase [Lentisphaerae bacterium]|nr:shikimate dehydrogenase [Lentisphaerota bacterium]